jgi:hypothetical protein
MSTGKGGHRRGFFGWLGSALKTLAGIMTALAAIATAAATILGFKVHDQTTQLAQVRVVVSQQAQRIHTLTQQAGHQAAPSPTATDGGTGTGTLASGGRYLSDLSPTVDNAGIDTGQQVISARQYTKSLLFYCDGGNGDQPDVAYDVAASSTFTAMVGIPDNMTDATDVTATVTFTNEADQRVGHSVQVSLGHPASVRLPINGVTQLGITCVGRDVRTGQQTNGFQVAIGNPRVS